MTICNYDEYKGAIWSLAYHVKAKIDSNVKQKLLDSQTNIISSTFNPPPGLSPEEYSTMFSAFYLKTRDKAKSLIEETSTIINDHFQLGEESSLSEIEKIEKSIDFIKWENPYLVDYFKNLSSIV